MFNSVTKKLAFALLCILAASAGGYLSFSVNNPEDFETLEGNEYRWSDLQGQFLVVNYFAEWCAPCLKEIPELNKFQQYANNNDKVSLFAVSFDELTIEQLNVLIDKYQIDFAVMKKPPLSAPFAAPKSLPSTYIISPTGELIKQLQGEQSSESLQNIIERLSERL